MCKKSCYKCPKNIKKHKQHTDWGFIIHAWKRVKTCYDRNKNSKSPQQSRDTDITVKKNMNVNCKCLNVYFNQLKWSQNNFKDRQSISFNIK